MNNLEKMKELIYLEKEFKNWSEESAKENGVTLQKIDLDIYNNTKQLNINFIFSDDGGEVNIICVYNSETLEQRYNLIKSVKGKGSGISYEYITDCYIAIEKIIEWFKK